MGIFIWLFLVRFCAYQGRKRVIGWFNGLVLGTLGIIGLLIVLSSRRLDDKQADAALIKKYSPVNVE
jgi:hypothetical protein